jgi:hypothetical protein
MMKTSQQGQKSWVCGLVGRIGALALLTGGCSSGDDAASDTATTTSSTTGDATTSTTGDATTSSTSSAGTMSGSATEDTSSGSTSESTGPACDPGSEGCECGRGGVCDGALVCQGGVCVSPPAGCGDGLVQDPEACDDRGESAVCDADCTAAVCGDGTVNAAAGEACDDQGESALCDADCSEAICGDGAVNAAAGEACDDQGESAECNADCTAAVCGDETLNQSAGEQCEGEAPDNASCEGCAITCEEGFDDCNTDLVDGCEQGLMDDPMHCGACDKVCGGGLPCKKGKCVDVSDAFAEYASEGRTVYLFKTSPCASLDPLVNFCEDKGLAWWKAQSQPDAQKLVDFAFGLDNWHTWVQVYDAKTTLNPGTVDGFTVTVDSPECVDGSPGGWTAFRKWGCSFCEPSNEGAKSCCWDIDHAYDWLVCEG